MWAEENSRDAIFDALKRRETFATSGPRIVPRLFGSWSFDPERCASPEFASTGYAEGVPMGGTLPERPDDSALPSFAVSALADPGTAANPGGLLQRIQIIKARVDAEGRFIQEIHDIAGDPHSVADVNLNTCTPRGPGARSLCGVWQDPGFEPDQDAIYYARIIENPSCRWSQRICRSLPSDRQPDGCRTDQLPKVIQERAWTSPIWYSSSPPERAPRTAGALLHPPGARGPSSL